MYVQGSYTAWKCKREKGKKHQEKLLSQSLRKCLPEGFALSISRANSTSNSLFHLVREGITPVENFAISMTPDGSANHREYFFANSISKSLPLMTMQRIGRLRFKFNWMTTNCQDHWLNEQWRKKFWWWKLECCFFLTTSTKNKIFIGMSERNSLCKICLTTYKLQGMICKLWGHVLFL